MLIDADYWWRCLSVEARHVVVEPEPSQRVAAILAGVRHIDESFVREKLGPRAAGTTAVEQADSLSEKLRRIDRLARSGSPSAWADLASCWRHVTLQPALKVAYQRIGWTKMTGLVRRIDGWPPGLVDLVETEFEHLNRVKRQMPWDPNDYLLKSTK